jgi:lysozyme
MSLLSDIVELMKPICRRFEGWRSQPYLCPARVWTQGYGHTGPEVTATSPVWTRPKGEAVLGSDAEIYARAVLALSPNLRLQPAEIGAALGDFCFNLGSTRYKASTLRRKVAEEDWEEVIEQLGKWVFGGGKRLPGLVARRAAEGELIRAALAQNDNAKGVAAPADPRAQLAAELRKLIETSQDPIADLLKLLQANAAAGQRAA